MSAYNELKFDGDCGKPSSRPQWTDKQSLLTADNIVFPVYRKSYIKNNQFFELS